MIVALPELFSYPFFFLERKMKQKCDSGDVLVCLKPVCVDPNQLLHSSASDPSLSLFTEAFLSILRVSLSGSVGYAFDW